jgi:hypothetical protein
VLWQGTGISECRLTILPDQPDAKSYNRYAEIDQSGTGLNFKLGH